MQEIISQTGYFVYGNKNEIYYSIQDTNYITALASYYRRKVSVRTLVSFKLNQLGREVVGIKLTEVKLLDSPKKLTSFRRGRRRKITNNLIKFGTEGMTIYTNAKHNEVWGSAVYYKRKISTEQYIGVPICNKKKETEIKAVKILKIKLLN